MDRKKKEKKLITYLSAAVSPLLPLFKSWYFYIGILSIFAGSGLNAASEIYLHNYMSEGKKLPILSDLILDHLPVYNVSLAYDIPALLAIAVVIIYFVHKKEYNRIPFFFVMSGIFYIVRAVFIILTPFGNPPLFNGSDPLFNGFAKYELGVYPSGHVGNVFLMFLLVKSKGYKWILGIFLIIVILALFFAHGHYSIDIFSGLFFAYALRSFGERHLPMFDLDYRKVP